MGKDAAQIEREIEAQRLLVREKVEAMRGHVRKDLDSVRGEAQGRASHAVGQAKGALDLHGQMEGHPYTMVAGALGLGVLLGVATDGKSAMRDQDMRAAAEAPARPSLAAEALLSVWGLAAGALQDEIRSLIHEGVAGLGERPEGAPAPAPAVDFEGRSEAGDHAVQETADVPSESVDAAQASSVSS